ncbi:unnamed protein product (macronuclear) [Paramecium tetraurelia]|uniref:Uncharacterized protein n=1 Tax=Paramecium tetraurelia TaxID=5888 RepID=A0BVV8_PARTE|nr:uncharacterized protein GSPATT00032527001 [Paramecium tetraurelia]CAK62675.1 unnamed protein product [Paramecium tetraurelia]|eukprot:XP_001430073.1 hypothetical protein (macronuclear) [Paramecium tetraurelia strain d4-2]
MEQQNQSSKNSQINDILQVLFHLLQEPISISSSDDCIEMNPQAYKVSILKHKLKKKQQNYSLAKILFGFRFDFQKATCLHCKQEGHINCCQINFPIDNIYKNK